MEKVLVGRPLVPGSAHGLAVVSNEPLSLCGGFDPHSGKITDVRHDRSGAVLAGKVFVFPFGKGSSTASRVLIEAIRCRRAPVAIVNAKVDPILVLGSVIAQEFYQEAVPIVVLSRADFDSIVQGDYLVIESSGTVRLRRDTEHHDQ